MSLVDYASSDEEDEAVGREECRNNNTKPLHEEKTHPLNEKSTKLSVQQSESSMKHSEPSTLKLPDASLLLNSPLPSNISGNYDHTSRVAAAMAQNESRKRDSKEPPASYPRGKIQRGNLPHPKNVSETTTHGLLRPPQLSGRSNVVTEDLNKLFTRRNGSEPSSNKLPGGS